MASANRPITWNATMFGMRSPDASITLSGIVSAGTPRAFARARPLTGLRQMRQIHPSEQQQARRREEQQEQWRLHVAED